jgi:hypothetical protein
MSPYALTDNNKKIDARVLKTKSSDATTPKKEDNVDKKNEKNNDQKVNQDPKNSKPQIQKWY